jgi:hypothetical protein
MFFYTPRCATGIVENALQASVATGIAMIGPGDTLKTEEDPENREVVV